MISVASEKRKGSRITRPGLSSRGDGMKSRLVRSRGNMQEPAYTGRVKQPASYNELLFVTPPRDEYRARLEYWRSKHAISDRRFRQIGNARLATGIAAVIVAATSLGAGWLSPWWLLL